MSTSIDRMSFATIADSLADERVELAKKAAAKLGYSNLAKAIAVPGALLFALRKLEIEPLVTSQVLAYQKKKAKPGMWSGHKAGLRWWLIASLIISVGGYWAWSIHNWGSYDPPMTLIGCGAFAAISLVRGCILLFDKDARGSRTTYEWKHCSIKEYAGNVPEYALAKALQIKAEVPEASFQVVRLFESKETIEPHPDPFLWVGKGDEGYYIEVWDEKEYERTL